MKKNGYAKYWLIMFVGFAYFFLYMPIIVLIIFSFNKNPFTYHWHGFTMDWYRELFESIEIWDALYNSLIVAIAAVVLSVSMGSLFVFYGMRRYAQGFLLLFYTNLALPEIVLAVGLMSFFSFFYVPLGLTTLIAAHTVLGMAYVIPIAYTRFSELDVSLIEASLDLGATQQQTLRRIVLPWLFPALFGAALLVFIISFDDFVISFFCSGASSQTLPLYIFSAIKAGETPVLSALSTLMLITSSLFILLFFLLQIRKK